MDSDEDSDEDAPACNNLARADRDPQVDRDAQAGRHARAGREQRRTAARRTSARMVINTENCKYRIVRQSAAQSGWTEAKMLLSCSETCAR